MAQTFEDMLEHQPSRFGRLLIWIRTLVNLPFSALGQHMNVKGGLVMTRKTMTVLAAGLLTLVIVAVGSFWLGHIKTAESAGIARVTTTSLADAMKQDHFYSDFGNSAVIFKGTVSSTELVKGLTIVTFKSHSSYGIACRFQTLPNVTIGDEIEVVAPGGQAIRQPFGVLLRDCEKA